MTAFLDLALAYDPARRRGDLVLGADGDLVLDATPATPMLVSLGTDRRARPDDPLPGSPPPQPSPASGGGGEQSEREGAFGNAGGGEPVQLTLRRGWAGDALDAEGRLIGSRLWLLERAKASELTRRLAEEWAREALAWAQSETGRAATVSAAWADLGRTGVLALTASVDGRTIALNRRVA